MQKTIPTARPAQTGIESLETRKLFAGFGHFAAQHFDGLAADGINVPFARGGGQGYAGGFGGYQHNLLFGGGAVAVTITYDPTLTVTASSTNTTSTPSGNTAAATAATPSASGVESTTANANANDAATRILINTVPPRTEPVAVKAGPVTNDAADVTPAVATDTSPAPVVAAGAPAVVRFSFASIGATGDHSEHASSGLVDLLSRQSRQAVNAIDFATTPARAGHSSNADGSTAATDAELEATAVVLPAAEQTTLAALPGQAGVNQPLWQRLAVATAGAVLVSANWIVRRRARKAALPGGAVRRV